MAKREKTTLAKVYAARLNPIHPQEQRAMDIIATLEDRGFNFKQIAVDAILRADGITPEMFPREGGVIAGMERMLEQFAREIIGEVRKRGGHVPDVENEDSAGDVSPFMKNFARSFAERQRKVNGDED